MLGWRGVPVAGLSVTLTVASAALPLFGQNGVVHGRVTDPEGRPLAAVEVEIRSMRVPRVLRAKTDEDGRFVHLGVPMLGRYRVVATLPGYARGYCRTIRAAFSVHDEKDGLCDLVLEPGDPSAPLDFELTAEEREAIARRAEEARARQRRLENSAATFESGLAAYDAGDYESARDAFLITAQTRPDEAVVWAALGDAYRGLNDPERAISAFDRAIVLDREQPDYYLKRGDLRASRQDPEAALADYDKAVALSPERLDRAGLSVRYFNIAVRSLNSEDFEGAAPVLKKALELQPTLADAVYFLAICHLNLGDRKAGLAGLKRYVELAPEGRYAIDAVTRIRELGGGR